MDQGVIALGEPKLGDLLRLPATREAFREHYRGQHPEATPTGVAAVSGQFFRFLHEMKSGDSVLYMPKGQGVIQLGRIDGEYAFASSGEPNFPHRRPVKWLGVVSTDTLSAGARFELGAPKTLFTVKSHSDEIIRILRKHG